jgi:hypothetical protein
MIIGDDELDAVQTARLLYVVATATIYTGKIPVIKQINWFTYGGNPVG